MHTDPKTSGKVFAHLDTIQHFSLELRFLSVFWARVPFSYVSQMLWGERFGWLMFGERLHIRKPVCFFQLYQCACYLMILQNLELLPANTVGSLWTTRATTPYAAPKELFHTAKIPNPPCPPL